MITGELLLENGYREWEVNKLFKPNSNRMFQKRFKNDKGQTKYFITFYEYYHEDIDEFNYEVDLQFEQDKYIMNILLFGIHDDMTLEDIEREVYAIWYGLDCKYYDYEEK